jgi:hypothetical protein
MWGVTAWVFATWLKWTVLFLLAVGMGWWWLGTDHGGFLLLCAAAALGELYVTRALLREWCSEARLSWWWSP